jgi:hypothetical protein
MVSFTINPAPKYAMFSRSVSAYSKAPKPEM